MLKDSDIAVWICRVVSPTFGEQPEYGGLFNGPWGPTNEVMNLAESPIDLFWFLFPKSLLQQIAEQSNLYAAQTVVKRAREIKAKQATSAARGNRSRDVESLMEIRQRLRSMPPFQPHEYANLFGLLIARMMCPHKRRLSSHWSLSSTGAIPAGTFNSWMPRNRYILCRGRGCVGRAKHNDSVVGRFDELMRHLHFSDNMDSRARTDRAWKIRPLIDTFQATFKKGYNPGPILSFDEGMLPSQSQFNGTRMYMKDKPHKWGTKMFLTCCPRTAYCLR